MENQVPIRLYLPEGHAQPERPNFCSQMAHSVVGHIKPFFVGVAWSVGCIMPVKEAITLSAQYARYIPWNDYASLKSKLLNPFSIVRITIMAPIIEEILFRFLIQDVLLTRIPKSLIKRIMPGRETLLDTKIAKIFRIVLTASLFALIHLSNLGTYSCSYVAIQVFGSFFSGVAYSVLKESKWGLLSTIGAHFTNNTVTVIFIRYFC